MVLFNSLLCNSCKWSLYVNQDCLLADFLIVIHLFKIMIKKNLNTNMLCIRYFFGLFALMYGRLRAFRLVSSSGLQKNLFKMFNTKIKIGQIIWEGPYFNQILSNRPLSSDIGLKLYTSMLDGMVRFCRSAITQCHYYSWIILPRESESWSDELNYAI